MRRIGVLLPAAADDAEFQARVGAFLQALALLGWTVGRNVRIDTRWATANADDIRRARGGIGRARAGRHPGHWQPRPWRRCYRRPAPCRSCSCSVIDPVGAGFVASLARPGGNATGFTQLRIQHERKMAGAAQRDRAARDAGGGPSGSGRRRRDRAVRRIQAVAPSFGVELSPVDVRDAGEIERAVAAFARGPNGGLIVTASALAIVHRELIITLAARHRAARGLLRPLLRHRRRPDLLRA